MKKFTWIGLGILMLMLAACNATTAQSNAPAHQPTESQTEKIEADSVDHEAPETEQTPVVEADTTEEMASEEAGAANDQITGSENIKEAPSAPATRESSHDGVCQDPFADVERIRFSTDVWSADAISRYVGADLVDPNSGLETNFCKHSADYADILSGGPPPDGIPPLDNPGFDSIAVGDEWLADVQPVIALAVGNKAKAYPLAILTRHEIANDEIAGIPVAVTFCPLCNAAVVFNRKVDGEVLRFGVSGNLRNSDLIMWDNKSLSWWQQFTGEAIVGDKTGTRLEMIPAQLVAWKDFKAAYPNGEVLSGGGRSYGSNPYAGYDSTTDPFLFPGTVDPRLRATERVLGYHKGDVAAAYPLTAIRDKKVIKDMLDGQNVVIFYEPGQTSALDKSSIEDSKEVGSAAMFIPVVDGRTLTFSSSGDKIIDNETDSEWDVFGRAIAGQLAGAQLEPVLSHVHFWFAWAAFRPDTFLYGS